jgi:hypothetical protein
MAGTCADARQSRGLYRKEMSTPATSTELSLPVRLAIILAASAVGCIAASVLIAYLIADHSSSDSSPSSLIAIGLGGLGFLTVLLSGALLGAIALVRHWRRPRRAPHSG